MLPPGMAFNAISDKALAAARSSKLSKSFWAWDDMLNMNKIGFFPYTPATQMLHGLAEGIAMLHEEGLDNVFARHDRLAEATRKAVSQLSAEALRDRAVYLDTSYLISSAYPLPENLFYVAELRTKLLVGGVRLAEKREKSQIVLEVRSGGIGIDRLEYLIGIPAIYLNGATGTSAAGANAPLATPELAIVKSTKQYGFASAAFVAYWADTGELVTSSGPFVGKTLREDWWILGFGPRTIGDIPPTEK
jgi:hypothetical protein